MMADLRKFTFPETMWAGTDHSLAFAMDVHDAMMAGLFDQTATQGAAADAIGEPPWNFSMQGDIGVVSIKGPLVNNDSAYNMYRGVTSYNDVRRAMIFAANNGAVKAILLDIDSGGGAVSGVADAGNLISTIDKGVKPVYAFSDGQMASAAYWLGVATRGVYASQTSMLGSIGVISTHKEYSKAFKDAGIGVTVMRSGEFKALNNSMEPLTEVAQKQLQAQLDAAYSVFANHVSTKLGVPLASFDATMGQGREFFGAQAVTVGLAKSVQTFDSMVALIDKKLIDSSAKREQTALNSPRGNSMTRAALTQAQIDAAAAGIALETELTPAQIAEAAAAAEATAAATAAAATAAAALAASQVQAGNDVTIVSYLQGKVKELEAAALSTGIEFNAAKAKIVSMEGTHGALMKIAASGVAAMKVGLGQTKADFSAMVPELLVAEHAATTLLFTKTFKVGGVAATSFADPKIENGAALPADHLARVAATQFPSAKK